MAVLKIYSIIFVVICLVINIDKLKEDKLNSIINIILYLLLLIYVIL